MTAEATIREARKLTEVLVNRERGRDACKIDEAISRLADRLGIEESAIRSLWNRWQNLTFVKAHVLEGLRDAYELFYEQQRQALIHEIEVAEKIGRRDPALEDRLRSLRALVGDEAE